MPILMQFITYASGSTGNMYEVTDGVTRILLECGLPIKEMQRLTGHTLSQFDSCVVSHEHKDHCKGVDALRKLMGHLFVQFGADLGDGGSMLIYGISIKHFNVPHDVENYGFIVKSVRDKESVVFITDAFYCPVVFDFSPTIFAIEANYAHDLITPDCPYSDRLIQSHMSLKQCLATLKANDLSKTREIHLLHLSAEHSDEARFVREVEAATGKPTYAAPAYRRAGR